MSWRFKRLDIALLVRALGRDALLAQHARARGRKRSVKRSHRLVRGHVQQRLHFLAVGDAPFEHALVVGIHNPRGALHLLGFAFDFQVVVPQMRADLQRGFEILQVFIEGAEELVDSPGNSDGLLHQVRRRLLP